MPNPIAFAALAAWPIVTIVLFQRLPRERALIYALMLGYLFLPELPASFDLPAFPALHKHNIPALAAFCVILFRGEMSGSILPDSALGKGLVLTFVLSPIATVMTNGEPVFFGQVGLPGLGLKDMIALPIEQFLLLVPFLLARQHLASGGAQRELLLALVAGALVYSVFMLIEMRLSPQLNAWIYGYYQHLFGQTVRFGGWRPIVFLYHGLWVAFFVMTAVVAAWGLWRFGAGQGRLKMLAAAIYLTIILVMAKSLGALIFAALLVPCVLLLSARAQIRVGLLLGLLALGYPLMKGADLVPQERLLETARAIDPDREGSLRFRFDNENTLLERAYLKPVFGWGSWGRNHILDPLSGIILTVTDGRWIIVIGVYGWVGFLAEFGLLLLPLVLVWRESVARGPTGVLPILAPLSLILGINMVDMLPNATLTPLTWLVSGAMLGYAERLRAERLRGGATDPQMARPAPDGGPRAGASPGWPSIL